MKKSNTKYQFIMASILTILAWIVFFQTTDIAGPVRTASAKPTSLEIPSKQLNLVAFSRDGNTLASTDGGLIVLWDVASGQERSTLSSQTTSLVSDIVFSQDGKTLASVSDNSIQLWDVVSGSARLTLPARGLVTNLVFSPDGKTLAAADQDDAQIKLWNSQSGSTNQIQTGHQNGVNVLVFSPDSSIIATGGKDAQIKLWDRVTGLESSQLTADISGAVTQLVFSPDGKTLAAVSQDDAQVTLWDSQSGAITQVQTGHQGGVNALAFSPDSKILSTGGQDARIKLWNRATGIEQVNLTGEVGAPVTSLVFSSDGQFLASVGESEKVFLWDVSKIQPQLLSGHTDWVDKIVFSSNKTLAGIDKSGQVILWNLLTGLEQETFQIPNFLSASLVNSQAQFVGNTISGASLQAGVSNTTAVTNSTSKTDASSLGTSENPTGKSKKKSAQKWKGVKAIAISQDGLEIGTASEDGMFRVFKKNGSQRWEVSGHHGKAIAGIAYLGKSKEWASVGRDTEITTWNATGKKIQTFYGPEHPPRALAVSPDGQFIATAGEETRVFLFDTKAGKLSAIFSGHVDFVNGLAFSPDGNTLASAGADGRIVLWEVRTGKPLRTLLGHADEVNTVAFSPDGGRLASASMDSTVILWNSSTGGQIKTLAGHQASVRTVAFNPNGKELVSAGEDTKMLVWDSTTGILKKQLAGPPAAINALVFGSDGILHAASENSDISEFNTDTGTNIETIVVPVSATVAPQASRSEIITVAMISNTVGLIASHLTEKSDLDSVKPNHATLSAIVNQLLDWVIPAANADVLPDPNQGPGGPILVVTTTADPFGRYYAEILRTEGLNAFTVTDISTVNTSLLSAYDVVILAPATLTPVQVTMFTDWVSSGGNLIAMRPDAQLANLLGLTDTGATLAEGYLLVDTSRAPGNGIVNQTIQFHGSAKRYTLNGASSLATLYSNASTLTTNPALTLSDVGTNGGQAAAFSFDLARSIVYTRQGNPAWATQERDGFTPIRSDDKFFGNATGDPQADWIDFNKIAIPQADEQQRLLANLILHMNSDKKPLPRFWYFPNGKKAVVIMTGDDHANNGTQGRFDQFIANSTPGCSVANWECIRGTSYIYPNTPLTPALAASYNTQGFEVGLHINTNCADFTPASLRTFYTQQIDTFKTKYSTIPAPITQRHHCIAWSDWVTGAIVQLENGIRFDTSYYFWPPSWVLNRPGFFSGSGMPMRFANLDGSMIDVYHAASQMTDESGQTYPFTIDTLLDRALGTEGYYGAFTINAHTDVATIPESDAVLASAPSRGVPIVSSKQMLDWLDGRNSSSFGTIAWNANALSFTVNQGTGANGLQVMLPLVSSAGVLTSVTRDGLSVSFTTDAIKGVTYAAFSGTTGAYVATYAVDITLPTVITQSPANGAASISQGASVTATFSKAMDAATVTTSTFELRDSSNNVVSATVSYNASTLTATLTPTASLASLTTYTAILKGGATDPRVKDLSGNALGGNVIWSFTTGTQQCSSSSCSAWTSSTIPGNPSVNDPSSVELGVKFKSDIDGFVTGIRFYKGTANTGTHTGTLWASDGTQLATAAFISETTTGWQQVNFSSPIAIIANTTYVASYHAPNGNYAGDNNYFSSAGVDNGVIHLLKDGVSGGNGVYAYSTNRTFPNNTYRSSNYWVDVVFTSNAGPDTTLPTLTAQSPAPSATGISTGAIITSIFSEPMDATTFNASTYELRDSANSLVTATISYSGANLTATLTPNSALNAGASYTAKVKGGVNGVKDLAGNALAADYTWSFTTGVDLCSSGSNPIACENSKIGNPSSEWDISGAGDASIQGYATDISVNRGQTARFKINTPSTNYRLDIYRMGYYAGNGARKVATIQPSVTLPQSQANCLNNTTTGLIDCGNWVESASWVVPADATSGIYFAKAVRQDGANTGSSHIVFIVRDDASTSDLLFHVNSSNKCITHQFFSVHAG